MPTININETDRTLYGLNENVSDNVVYIPGNAITGPSSSPVLLTSYSEFINKFGSHGVDDSLTWEYVAGILLAGFPVLFKRITTGTNGTESLVEKAKLEVKYSEDGDSITYDPKAGTKTSFTVVEKYGGSYGNSLSFYMENSFNDIIAKVKRGNILVESVILAAVGSDADNTKISNAIKGKLSDPKTFESITVNINETDFKYVEIPDESSTESTLSGGTDALNNKINEVMSQSVSEGDFGFSPFGDISDKYVNDVKFVTSGGYVGNDEESCKAIAKAMDTLCNYRKDCFAIPDSPLATEAINANTYFNDAELSSYSANYAPWFLMNLDTRNTEWMPPSFVFLTALADAVTKNNVPLWYPPAGVSRMQVTRAIEPRYEIGGALMNKWQQDDKQSINPIMKIRGYGYCVYGQRTLYTPTSTTSSALKAVNVRLTANEIKRQIFNVSIGLTFEQNVIYTWNTFVSRLEPLLISMKSDNGLYDYQIIMDRSTITNNDINNQKAVGIVRVSVVNAIEHFDIGFELEPYGVTFTSEATEIQ